MGSFLGGHDEGGSSNSEIRRKEPADEDSSVARSPSGGAARGEGSQKGRDHHSRHGEGKAPGCRSMWVHSVIFCASMAKRLKNRNWSRLSSWAAGAAGRRLCSRRTEMIRSLARICSGPMILTTKKWTHTVMQCRLARIFAE